MTIPGPAAPDRAGGSSSPIRAAIWIAIGALIAAAIVCVIWVFVGSGDGIVGRAFATILLLVGFSGATVLDAHLAPRRPAWFALSSMAGWILILLIGAVMIWMPERYAYASLGRIIQFLLVVLVVQLALLHLRLFSKASQRYVTTFTQVVTIITVALVVGLTTLLILPLVLWEYVMFTDLYGRVIVATAILAAVGTAVIPLVNMLFAPKKPQPAAHAPAPALAWPTYVDGATPLPVMPDGSPDWNAYYTGYPSYGAHVAAPPTPREPASHPQAPPPAPGYEGYPPPPPLPDRH